MSEQNKTKAMIKFHSLRHVVQWYKYSWSFSSLAIAGHLHVRGYQTCMHAYVIFIHLNKPISTSGTQRDYAPLK